MKCRIWFLSASVIACVLASLPLAASPRVLSTDDELSQFSSAVPGFGGLFYDEEGRPTVYLTDLTQKSLVESLGKDVRVLEAQYTFEQLRGWRDELLPVLATEGVVYLDVDETSNRVVIAVEERLRVSGASSVHRAVERAGVGSAVIIRYTEPVTPLANLRSRLRPVPAGAQIAFGGSHCTLGFNARIGGVLGFVTNSHCTNIQGGVEGTAYGQPSTSHPIGVEEEDPIYTTGGNCPAGRRCRRSDSAFVRYQGAGADFGHLARALPCSGTSGSLSILENYNIGGVGAAIAGQTVRKTGRTTGCTFGQVTGTSMTVNVAGTNITLFDQNRVAAGVGPGDSGSPVYVLNSREGAILVGLLWGGTGSATFFYSPMADVITELSGGAAVEVGNVDFTPRLSCSFSGPRERGFCSATPTATGFTYDFIASGGVHLGTRPNTFPARSATCSGPGSVRVTVTAPNGTSDTARVSVSCN